MELEAFERLCRNCDVLRIMFTPERAVPILAQVGSDDVQAPSLQALAAKLEALAETNQESLWAVVRFSTLTELVEGHVRSIYIDLFPHAGVAGRLREVGSDWTSVRCETSRPWDRGYAVYHLYANESAAQRDARLCGDHLCWIAPAGNR